MTTSINQQAEVERELREAGIIKKGTARFAFNFLKKVIEPDEKIVAAVFGRYHSDGGWLNWSTGMLVATDKRVIFLDHKPGYTNMDEISYRVVAGIKLMKAGPFSSVTLHTRAGDFTIRYAEPFEIEKFQHYIEYRIETDGYGGN